METINLTNEQTLIVQDSKISSISEKFMALLGFSRVIIGVFVLAQSALGALLALRHLPSIDVIIIGSIACLAGSYSLVAFNDLMDIPIDKLRFDNKLREVEGFDIGSAFERHPVARGIISYKLAVAWIILMAAISAAGILYIKPALLLILPAIAFFVMSYSLLSLKSPLKVIAVAIAVTLGGVAGWIAVASTNSLLFWLFVVWTFSWEIGGRNVPNDFNDVEEDKEIGIQTFPVIYGCDAAAHIIMVFLTITTTVGIPLVWISTLSIFWTVLAFVLAVFFLIIPGWRLMKDSVPQSSMKLYNRSAFYPPAMLLLLLIAFYL